jgi:AAA domain-containing protein
MPIPASALETEEFLRLLLLSWPKRGATTHAISTAIPPVRVLLCEGTNTALAGAKRETDKFDVEFVRGWDTMMKYLIEAKTDAKNGTIKTVVVDPLNFFADKLLIEMFQATKTNQGADDGRKAHPEFTKRIKHAIELMQTIPAHLIVINHYQEVGGGDDNDKPKNGVGLVPLMPNMASRSAVAAMFHDIVWFDYAPNGFADHFRNRVFVTSADGVWGPGCRSVTKNKLVPAHIGQFIDIARGVGDGKVNGGVAKRPAAPPPAKVVRPQPPPARR